MMMRVLVLATVAAGVANSFSVGSRSYAGRATATARSVRRGPVMAGQPSGEGSVTTRRALFLPAAGAVLGWGVAAHPAAALVKGSAPPPKKEKREKRTCTTIDECEEVGRQREAEMFNTDDLAESEKTTAGDAYRDLVVGTGEDEVKAGAAVDIKYRVLRLGKRSSDGLSGEASPVFSFGYGEDEDKETDVTTIYIGSGSVVPALDDALRGMKIGGRRRINVRPERGWKLPDNICLKTYTDVTIVPTTKVQDNDACFSTTRQPTPSNYGAKRRMLRRYDETLIVDCEVVKINMSAGDGF